MTAGNLSEAEIFAEAVGEFASSLGIVIGVDGGARPAVGQRVAIVPNHV